MGAPLDPYTYTGILFMLLAFPRGLGHFLVVVIALPVGVGTSVTLVGLPILLGALLLSRQLARLERAFVRVLLGVEIPPPYRHPASPGFWADLRCRLSDPATWKDLFYLIVALPLGAIAMGMTVALLAAGGALVVAPVLALAGEDGVSLLGVEAEGVAGAVVLGVLGLPLVWAILIGLRSLGRLWARYAELVLGAEPDPELTARVDDLRTSRARILSAQDAERRRLERDLHDGAQQRLVALALKLGLARTRIDGDARELVEEAHEEARLAIAELRDLARGLHPAILTDRGLAAALDEVAARSPIPAEVLEAPADRLDPPVEAAAYFVVSEALTNVAKYAQASHATIRVARHGDRLRIEVADDGVGGASPDGGSGLAGLADRVGALDGTLTIDSPPGQGTRVRAKIPL